LWGPVRRQNKKMRQHKRECEEDKGRTTKSKGNKRENLKSIHLPKGKTKVSLMAPLLVSTL